MRETTPQIEQLLKSDQVVPRIQQAIQDELRENSHLRERLQSFGVRTPGDFEDLRARVGRAAVSYRERVVRPWDHLRDAQGESSSLAEQLRFRGSQAVLLLIDPYPGANWGHPCWIATYDVDNSEIHQALNDFPPAETADRQLVPYSTMQTRER